MLSSCDPNFQSVHSAHQTAVVQVGRLTRDMASRGREVHYMPTQSGAG